LAGFPEKRLFTPNLTLGLPEMASKTPTGMVPLSGTRICVLWCTITVPKLKQYIPV
jgi:hypothetical protein